MHNCVMAQNNKLLYILCIYIYIYYRYVYIYIYNMCIYIYIYIYCRSSRRCCIACFASTTVMMPSRIMRALSVAVR